MTDPRPYRPLTLEPIGFVDWERMAFPQDDQYDTAVFERIAALRYGWQLNELAPGTPTWLDGRVEIREPEPSPWGSTDYKVIAPDDIRWSQAAELARTWPAQYEQFRRLVNYVGAAYRPEDELACGCSCGPPGGNPFLPEMPIRADYWGCVFSTMNTGSGFIEGISHELAHWRGYALGVYIEDWERLIFSNDPPERQWIDTAPSRADRLAMSEATRQIWIDRGIGLQPFNDKMRPLGAMFQEIWVMIHMIEYHLRILPLVAREGGFPNEVDIGTFKEWATFHVMRSLRGHRDLVDIARPTPVIGEAFWAGYCGWVDSLKTRASEAYEREF